MNRIGVVLFVLSLAACGIREDRSNYEPIIDKTKLQEGDLVFRLGRGTSSQIVYRADRDRAYSHIGILVKDSVGEWYVIHAVPGESAETGGVEVLKCDPLLLFFGYDRTVRGAVVRFEAMDDIAEQVISKTWEYYDRQPLFDHNYLLSDSTVLYCTELVYRAFLSAGVDLTEGRRHAMPLLKEAVIFPSDILRNDGLWEVSPVKFVER